MFLKWWAKFTVNRKKQSGLAFEEINPALWAHSEAVTAMHCSFFLGFLGWIQVWLTLEVKMTESDSFPGLVLCLGSPRSI